MKVLNYGSLNLDYVYEVPHFVREGETLASLSRQIFCGGKGLNQSIALSKAGCEVYHAGSIGKEGEILVEMLRENGVNTDFIKISDVATGHAIIQRNISGNNCILLHGGANKEIKRDDIDAVISRFNKGDYLILQNEVSEVNYMIKKAKKVGMTVVLNPSPISEELISYDLDLVDCFLVNEIEGADILGIKTNDENEIISGLKNRFKNAKVVLTLGSDGSVYIDKDSVIRQEAYKVKVVDTTAAGDTFTGFFIATISSGKSPAEALKIASKAASIAVGRRGAAPSIPDISEISQSDQD